MKIKTFWKAENGSAAMMFIGVLVPMLLAAGIAIDYARAVSTKRYLQYATDAAAIAGASMFGDSNPSNGERQERAIKVLTSNIEELADQNGLQRTVNFGDGQINISVSASVKTTLAALIMPEVEVTASSSARFRTFSAPLCLLAMNPVAAEAFKAWGTADLIAPDCAVQSHSLSAMGMATGGSATATAAHFCSAGGHTGTGFDPVVEDNCKPSNDPYVGKYTVTALQSAGVNVKASCNESTSLSLKQETVTYDAGGPLNAYVFCAGLKMGAGAVAEFKPGVYVFYGKVDIGSGATVNAPAGVTFFMARSGIVMATVSETDGALIEAERDDVSAGDGTINVQAGASVNLVAPKSGPLAGMAVVNPTVSTYTGGSTPAATHTIIGGGTINIVGTIYAPQAKIRVTGNGVINHTSSYFSIVADQIELEGNGELHINAGADAMATGMPEMASMGDGGSSSARLVE